MRGILMYSNIYWKDEYRIGIASIDAEHKHLTEICSRLCNIIDNGLIDNNFVEILEELAEYVTLHFKREEEYMLKHNYEDYQAHKIHHEALTKDVFKIIDSVKDNTYDMTKAPELLAFLVDWLINHITHLDIQLAIIEHEKQIKNSLKSLYSKLKYSFVHIISHLKIWQQIALIAFIPLMVVFYLLIVQFTEYYTKVEYIKDINSWSDKTIKLQKIIHEVQQERGFSVTTLSSLEGYLHDKLMSQRKRTDNIMKLNLKYFPQFQHIQEQINTLRIQVDKKEMISIKILNSYSTIIDELLKHFNDIDDSIKQYPEIYHAIITLQSIIRHEEDSGRERAIGSTIIVQKEKGKELLPLMIESQTNRNAEILSFLRFATAAQRKTYSQIANVGLEKHISNLRRKIILAIAKDKYAHLDITMWWNATTKGIDQFQTLEQVTVDLLKDLSYKLKYDSQKQLSIFIIVITTVLILVICLTIGIARSITVPLRELTNGLKSLASQCNNNFVAGYYLENEVGDMVRAYDKLRCAMIRAELTECAKNQALGSAVKKSKDLLVEKKKGKELKELANIDPLTKLLNRRGFDERIVPLFNGNSDLKACVLILDIDFFKHVNDTYGHDIGDVVLQRVAETLNKAVREDDIIARFGGEEFIAMLTNCDINTAETTAQRMLEAVRTLDIYTAKHHIKITISIGISELLPDDTNIDKALKRSDEALYTAKQSGRNRAVKAPNKKSEKS